MNLPHLLGPLALATFTSVCFAQLITPTPACAQDDKDGVYRTPPLTYPMTSDRYLVQYKVGAGNWTDVRVYISYYGGTNATPNRSSSGYAADTSMSFASIPVSAGAAVALRVTKLFGSPFPAINHVSVRPTAKGIHIDSSSGNLVQLSTSTAANFAGDQFLLWWDGDTQQSSIIQSLVFFLNPPYARPTGSNVKVVAAPADLTGNLSSFDTLDFEGTVAIGSTGAQAFVVPTNIRNVFLGSGAWVQGKLRFQQDGLGNLRRIYGPGVLDGSRFEYDLRACGNNSGYADQGYHALSWADLAQPNKSVPDAVLLDGIVITDHNHAVADSLANSTVNNVNSLGWNSLNGGFRIGQNTSLSNLFIRAGDDSLMMWGAFITVTNATVWQDYNGAVVNLGWGNDSPGDYGLIDGLYVVKTDWSIPTVPSWTATKLSGQNDAVIASLMTPGTAFGTVQPPLYRNIFVEDPPQTLLSLKITFPECDDPNSPRFGTCQDATLTDSSVLNLNIENLSSPPSVVENSIGFQTLVPGFTDGNQTFPNGYTLTGNMNIGLSNTVVTSPNGMGTVLTSTNAAAVGKIATNGGQINQHFTPTATQALAQIAAGGTLTTGIFILNTSTVLSQFSLQFHDDQGNPLSLPFTTGSTNTLSGSLPPQGSAYFEAGNPQIATLQGWAQVTSDSPIVVQALFRNNVNGNYYEAAVPSTPIGNEFVIPFDATTFATTGQPFVTGIAIANLDPVVANVSCTVYNSNGVAVPNAVPVPSLAPLGHWAAFTFPLLNGLRGTIDCVSNTNISGVALRALGSELTSLPVVTNPASLTGSSNTGALAQLAAGEGLITGFFFLNTGNAPANYSMNIYSDQGNRIAMPFANGTSNQLAGTIPAHGLAYYETINPQVPLQQGWGLFTADAPIVVQALFRNGVNGTYYEAAVPSTPGGINEVVFPFDATTFAATGQPLVTGVAISNLNTFSANVTCVASDQNGIVIPNAVQIPALPSLGHWAGFQFPALSGKRGTIDCTSNTNISATALRALGSGLSSLPVVTK